MSQSSPKPYVEFNFQDSLRKYEPPLRKKVKNTFESYSASFCKNLYQSSKQKIAAVWGSKKKLEGLSKEKGSSYSRMIHQQREIQKKQISDFSSDPIFSTASENINFWDHIQLKAPRRWGEKREDGRKELKEKIRRCINDEMNNVVQKIEEQERRVRQKQKKQQEQIEQTIKKVEGLHQELLANFESSVSEIVESVNLVEKIPEVGEDKVTELKEVDSMEEEKAEEKEEGGEQEKAEWEMLNPFLREDILYNGGRIRFLEQKTECYLSARIFTRAIQTAALDQVKKHHPYLVKTVEQIAKVLREDLSTKPK